MAKYLVLLFFLFITSCKTTEVVTRDTSNLDTVVFDAVSKSLNFSEYEKNNANQIAKELIYEWYNNQIKTNGFEGQLEINVSKIETVSEKLDNYFKITANILIDFKLENTTLKSKKSYTVEATEFAEISGSFSILDQENLTANVVRLALKKITNKINTLI